MFRQNDPELHLTRYRGYLLPCTCLILSERLTKGLGRTGVISHQQETKESYAFSDSYGTPSTPFPQENRWRDNYEMACQEMAPGAVPGSSLASKTNSGQSWAPW